MLENKLKGRTCLNLKEKVINRGRFYRNNIESIESHKGLNILEKYYGYMNPFSNFNLNLCSSRDLPLYIANGLNYDIDYIMNRLFMRTSMPYNLSETIFAGGKGLDFPKVFASGLGEGLERIFGLLYYYKIQDELVYGTYKDLTNQGYTCLHPEEIGLFSEDYYYDNDFIYDRFTSNSKVMWIEGERFFSKEKIWVPAQMILLFYPFRKDEAAIGYSTSGGLSCHNTKKEALYHGITEIFERDILNIHWYCKIPPKKIIIDCEFEDYKLKSKYLSDRLDEVDFYYHSLEGEESFPVVTAIKREKSLNKYGFLAGGGISSDIEGAIISALGEFGQAENNLKSVLYTPDWFTAKGVQHLFDVREDIDINEIDLFYQIVPFYGYKKNMDRLAWYLDSGEAINLSELKQYKPKNDKWEHLIKILKNMDTDPIIYDFTLPGIEDVKIIKSFIPELTQAFIVSLPLLGHKRYYKYLQKFRHDKVNSDPIPYP